MFITSAAISCAACGFAKESAAFAIDSNRVEDAIIDITRSTSISGFISASRITSAAILRPNISAFASCGELPIAGGNGTRMLGLPSTASSLSVAAPERHNTSVEASSAAGISSSMYATS